MIKLFRNIRKKLINKSKIASYLLYAIGEIILVMIGILLALQVNSYYQNLQDRKLEYSLLKELQNNIKNDSLSIASKLNNFKRISDNVFYLDSIIRFKRPYEKKVDSAFGVISTFTVTESNYVPFDKIKTLKNGIIKNDSLFNSLSNYYNFSKFLSRVDLYYKNGEYFRKDIYPKYFKGYRYGSYAIVDDYQKILKSNEIKVAIDYCKNDAEFYYNRTKHRAEHAAELIEMITNELQRFEK